MATNTEYAIRADILTDPDENIWTEFYVQAIDIDEYMIDEYKPCITCMTTIYEKSLSYKDRDNANLECIANALQDLFPEAVIKRVTLKTKITVERFIKSVECYW